MIRLSRIAMRHVIGSRVVGRRCDKGRCLESMMLEQMAASPCRSKGPGCCIDAEIRAERITWRIG